MYLKGFVTQWQQKSRLINAFFAHYFYLAKVGLHNI